MIGRNDCKDRKKQSQGQETTSARAEDNNYKGKGGMTAIIRGNDCKTIVKAHGNDRKGKKNICIGREE